jgi:shikimate 5-dehydrogenase
LREYSKTHPVIHVVRDEESIHGYLKTVDRAKIRDLLRASGSVFRNCSNYDFYNISPRTQQGKLHPESHSKGHFDTPFLTLKKAQRHFLKLIALIMAKGSVAALEAAYPLSHTPVELRPFTYAVSIPVSLISGGDVDIEKVESGSDAFEIVVDNSPTEPSLSPSTLSLLHRITRAFAEVRHSTIIPLIYHVEHQSQNQGLDDRENKTQMQAKYLGLVRHGLRLAPEFITIDLQLNDSDILRISNEKGAAKLIGHMSYAHNDAPGWDDAEWMKTYKRAVRLGCEVVRFSRPATTFEDNFAVQRFRDKAAVSTISRIPLIAYNTRPLGRLSALLNPTLTTVRHETLPLNVTLDQPCLTAKDCTEALSHSFVIDPMRFWIIGARIGYSLSPAMHNAAFMLCGLPHKYEMYQTPTTASLDELVKNPNFGGASVSLPFKIEVISLTHSLSTAARAIGAVNTLIPVRNLDPAGGIPDNLSLLNERNRAGTVKALYGENTDWIGIRACIRRGLSPINSVRLQTTAVVVGAGGMARAAVYALIQLGVKNIFIHNRTLANAERLVNHYQQLLSGSGDFPSSSLGSHFRDVKLHVLVSRDSPWPSEYRNPTIHVSCVPTHSIGNDPAPRFTMPTQWLKSPTGGVVLEVIQYLVVFARQN